MQALHFALAGAKEERTLRGLDAELKADSLTRDQVESFSSQLAVALMPFIPVERLAEYREVVQTLMGKIPEPEVI